MPILGLTTLVAGTAVTVSCSCGNTGGDEPEKQEPLCFTDVKDDDNKASVIRYITANDEEISGIHIQKSFDGETWEDWNRNEYVELNVDDEDETNDKLFVRNTENHLSTGPSQWVRFETGEYWENGQIMASGSVNSMINYAPLSNYCFATLFNDCINLISAPELPAKTLANYCYDEMFNGCWYLVSAPELPATTLADYCYHSMFEGCHGLSSAPKLPSETMASYCYDHMFADCTQIRSTPNLPSTQLAESCYADMFNGCENLVSASSLPATTLADYCYFQMFKNCTALKITETSSGETHKIFEYTDSAADLPVEDMFTYINSQSSFDGTPVQGNTYYWYA